jgi:hypothetical protein
LVCEASDVEACSEAHVRDGPEELDATSCDVVADETVLDEGYEVGYGLFAVDYEERREDDECADD